jgi:hypothetical protein
LQQLVLLAPERTVTNLVIEVVVELIQFLFQPSLPDTF